MTFKSWMTLLAIVIVLSCDQVIVIKENIILFV